MHSMGTDVEGSALRQRYLQSGFLPVILVSAAFSLPVCAEEPMLDPGLTVEAEVLTPEMHRAELRRALASELDRDAVREKRKLSGQEREALHRDLRDAMRNVNAERDARVERKQR